MRELRKATKKLKTMQASFEKYIDLSIVRGTSNNEFNINKDIYGRKIWELEQARAEVVSKILPNR